ncbi:MAG TPA: OmpH family outer membrane protein [Anaeromyxobacter sp.]|nr:OmpH family outer membrane protein [Anaeromyxobacter sp.]
MRPILSTILIALSLGSAPAARAADMRVAVVDYRRAVHEVDEGKAIDSTLRRELEDKQKQLDAKQAELETMRSDFEKQQAVLSDQMKQSKAADIEKRFNDVRQFYVQLQQELAGREQEATKGITERMNGLVREIAEGEGLQVVLEGGSVVWAAPALDLTNEVIRKYNAKYPLKAAAKPAPAPSAPATPATPKK